MSRLIDADAMIDRLKEWDTKDKTDKALYNFTLNRINEQPTIQPERPTEPQITTCHDCMWNDGTAYCEMHFRNVKGKDFCSWAEKR